MSSPPRTPIEGRFCRIEPLDADRHGQDLFAAFLKDEVNGNWTYLPYGPFETEGDFLGWLTSTCLGDDPLFHTIVDEATGKAVGVASYLRIDTFGGRHRDRAYPLLATLAASACGHRSDVFC